MAAAVLNSPLRADVLKLDFLDDDDAASSLQEGWVGISGPSWQVTSGDISMTVTPMGTVTLDDRNRTNNGGGSEADMWKDFLFANLSNAAGDGIQMAFTGLKPSTAYPITIWAFDKSTASGNHITDWSANDGAAGAYVLKGKTSFNGANAAPVSLADYKVSFVFTTDAAGAVNIQGLWAPETVAGHTVFINGLAIGDPGAPTGISLSPTPASVASGAPVGTLAGTLSSVSTLPNDTFTYSLVDGEGGTENAYFTLTGTGNNELKVNGDLTFVGFATASIRIRVVNSLNVALESQFTINLRDDTDNDGLLDPWEHLHFSEAGLDTKPGDDPDQDGSPNLNEHAQKTDPVAADTDGDTLKDGAEKGNGIFVSLADTGTNPLSTDTDQDGLPDNVENPLLPSTGLEQPGTDPNKKDTDGDGYGDKYEISKTSDPKNPAVFPLPAGLLIDFSHGPAVVGGQAAGTQLMNGYQTFTADHEINGSVDRTEIYPAFGSQVSLKVAFPDTTGAGVKQLINRPDGNNANYKGEKVDLLRDWIGIDARLASGGRGTEEFTSMTFTLTGLPAGNYQYRSYSHDTELQHPDFEVGIADAVGTRTEGPFTMTASTNNATTNPAPVNPGLGEGPEILPSTVTVAVRSDGTNPVVITYRCREAAGTASVFGVNGFELTGTGAVTEVPLKFSAITRNPATGAVTLQWEGTPGASHTVQKSDALAGWEALGTSTTGTYTDTPPAGTEVRFYRITKP
ncbi:MAG: hypothetical protein V4726_12985 [Verrucomicrobiota bacterium]